MPLAVDRLIVEQPTVRQDVPEFRDRHGDTGPTIHAKSAPVLSDPMQRFVALSPFCVVSSQDVTGATDVSPRGDAPGFVEILDPGLLLIPDCPGNQRFDTFRNVLTNPPMSILFLIPGVFDTLRVNGRGLVTRDPAIRIDRKQAHSLVELMMSQIEVSEKDRQAQDRRIVDDIKNNIY